MTDGANPDPEVREALRLDRERRVRDALAAYERILERRPGHTDIRYNLAVLHRPIGQVVPALSADERKLKSALAANPRFVSALLNLANLSEDLGRRAEARARLANLDPRVSAAALGSPAANSANRASLGFALERLLDAARDYDRAFAAYAEANRASRASAPPGTAHHDRRSQQQAVDRPIAAPAAVTRRPGGVRAAPAELYLRHLPFGLDVDRAVAGCASGRRQRRRARAVPRVARRARRGTRGGARRGLPRGARTPLPGRRVRNRPAPENFHNIGLIQMLFPGAKIVHAVRAPLDNCLAIYFLHLDQRRAWALELMDIGHYFREYHRLMTHWKTLCGDAIYDLNYGELVRAPDATPAGLGRFLGVELGSPSAAGATGARAIKTASARQARQPPCATSSGRAAHRARERNGLRAYLADVQPDTGPARHA